MLILSVAPPAVAAPVRRAEVQVSVGGPIAQHVRQALPAKLAQALVDYPLDGFAPGARLLVRVTTIYLSSDGGFGRFGGGLAMPDTIEAELLIVDARGRVIATRPITANSPANSGGGAMNPYNEPRRVDALMNSLAYWGVRAFR